MINGSSFWLWIGYDTEKRADLYVMGESISDLLVNMDAQGFFDDAEIGEFYDILITDHSDYDLYGKLNADCK